MTPSRYASLTAIVLIGSVLPSGCGSSAGAIPPVSTQPAQVAPVQSATAIPTPSFLYCTAAGEAINAGASGDWSEAAAAWYSAERDAAINRDNQGELAFFALEGDATNLANPYLAPLRYQQFMNQYRSDLARPALVADLGVCPPAATIPVG